MFVKTSILLTFCWLQAPKFHCFCQKSFELFSRQIYYNETFSKMFFSGLCSRTQFLIFRATFRESLWKTRLFYVSTEFQRKKFHWFRQHRFDLYFSTDTLGEKNWKQTLRKFFFRPCFPNRFVLVQKSINMSTGFER